MKVRLIEFNNASIGDWSALDELMAYEMYEGVFENTVVILRWNAENPSVGIGPFEDGDMLNAGIAEAEGFHCGRRNAFGGGAGVYTKEIPIVIFWYKKPYDRETANILTESNINGAANADALQKVGIPAVYKPIGDTEVPIDNMRYKVIASGANNFHLPDYWTTCASVIWDILSDKSMQMFGKAVKLPPEKFEDKKHKDYTGRMKPIKLLFDDLKKEVPQEDIIQSIIEENVKALFGNAEVKSESLSNEENEYLKRMVPFFESDSWINRFSTKRMAKRHPLDFFVGQAAYKSRKLVKASILLDANRERIQEAMFTADWFLRPAPSINNLGGVGELNRSVVGLNPKDEDGLLKAIKTVFDSPEFDTPLIEAEHLVNPLIRAAQTARPVGEFLKE